MFRRLFPVFLVLGLFLTNHSCHETTTRNTAVNWWDSIQEAREDSVALMPLKQELDRFLASWYVDSATTSFLIIDDTDEDPVVLAEFHPNQLLIPASVQKILVTGAALEILGEQSRRDVTIVNQQSHNGLANKLLKNIGKTVTGERSYTTGSRSVIDFWKMKGVDMAGVHLADGSGRRYDNFLTSRQLVDILYYETTAPTFGTFYTSLPLAGRSGTLRKTLQGTLAEGRIRAKTGTLAAIKSLAGYVNTVSGRKLIFAFLVNNYRCREYTLKRRLDEIMLRMVEL